MRWKDAQHVARGQAAAFRVGHAGRKSRVEPVEVDGHVDRAARDRDLLRVELVHSHDLDAETPGLVLLVGVERADADLDQPLRQALLHDAGERHACE
jgi:hypothetical protein